MNRGRPYTTAGATRRLLLLAALSLSCGTTRPPPPAPTVERRPAVRQTQEGLASYYSSRLTGRRTASGDRYHPDALTAAHLRLRFGTVVRVTRLGPDGQPRGPSVVVRINDRGPYGGRGRIIDLSMAAARRLDMVRAGVVRVRVEVLGN